ncbi:uncharacterized protein [Gossypium hirsutum]|uniref:Uncharacterized protein isoform X4 n=1 Tax=Gossypium hirsutum TaxID=3635 RepID=A0ABM3BC60_GOSHI|nr:uncharacterized protein LOC121225018 isoform X4 [Gossypium hirsutum]
MKSEGSDNEEDWDPVVVLASLKNAKFHEKAALELENAKREVLEGIGIGKDKKDKEEASPEDKDNEVTATMEGCEADIALILDSLANAMLDEKTASELKKAKTRSLKDEGSSSDIHGRNDESGQKQRERSPPPPTQFMGRSILLLQVPFRLTSLHQNDLFISPFPISRTGYNLKLKIHGELPQSIDFAI